MLNMLWHIYEFETLHTDDKKVKNQSPRLELLLFTCLAIYTFLLAFYNQNIPSFLLAWIYEVLSNHLTATSRES